MWLRGPEAGVDVGLQPVPCVELDGVVVEPQLVGALEQQPLGLATVVKAVSQQVLVAALVTTPVLVGLRDAQVGAGSARPGADRR